MYKIQMSLHQHFVISKMFIFLGISFNFICYPPSFDVSKNRPKIGPNPKIDRSPVVELEKANIFIHTYKVRFHTSIKRQLTHFNTKNTEYPGILPKMRQTLLLSGLIGAAFGAVVPREVNQTEYEYVVIGSGAGGGAVA